MSLYYLNKRSTSGISTFGYVMLFTLSNILPTNGKFHLKHPVLYATCHSCHVALGKVERRVGYNLAQP
jgi:hypothetical protein